MWSETSAGPMTVVTPANRKQLRREPTLKTFNTDFNGRRVKIVQTFGKFKEQYKIFMQPWNRDLKLAILMH